MKNKKLKFTIAGGIILVLLIIFYIIFAFLNHKIDSAIIIAWLGSFNIWFGIYCHANVRVKKIISENYKPELNDALKGGPFG